MTEVSQEPTICVSQLVDQWREQAANAAAYDQRQLAEVLLGCAAELEELTRRLLAEAVAESDQDDDLRQVARARVDAADAMSATQHPDERKQRAAELLAGVWTIGEDVDVRPVDWDTAIDLPGAALWMMRLVDRRNERRGERRS